MTIVGRFASRRNLATTLSNDFLRVSERSPGYDSRSAGEVRSRWTGQSTVRSSVCWVLLIAIDLLADRLRDEFVDFWEVFL